jgi:hypothetical protein
MKHRVSFRCNIQYRGIALQAKCDCVRASIGTGPRCEQVTIANCAIAPRSRSAKKGDRTPKGKNLSLMGGKTTIRATGSSRGRYGHFCRTGDPETVTISQ